jgi:hypothetical protein
MKGFSSRENIVKNQIQSIINQEEVGKLIKRYKKLKKFKKSNLHTINKLDGKKDIIQELINEYMENT